MMNLNDEKSSEISEILGNKTCKKILGLLAERESALSVGDISRELKLPINTADYNVKKLLEAGFINKSSSFFWSVKGKKIPTYSLANKKILISTKKSFKGIIASVLAGGAIFGGMKVLMNYKALNIISSSQNLLTEKSLDLSYSAGSAPAVAETAAFVSQSVWSNVGVFILIGLIAGLLGFLLYNKLKGGKN